jgi:hypothetical protein
MVIDQIQSPNSGVGSSTGLAQLTQLFALPVICYAARTITPKMSGQPLAISPYMLSIYQ